MNKLAIRGDHFKKDDVIKLLEELGGTNSSNLDGSDPSAYYYIGGPGGDILSSRGSGRILELECFTLDEFLKKYPFRVGDEVLYDSDVVEISSMRWDFGDILYYFYYKGVLRCGSKYSFKPNKKEITMRYTVGDKVRIKGLEWYESKASQDIKCGEQVFYKRMARFCGDPRIIKEVHDSYYKLENDFFDDNWNDEMIEGLIEPAPQDTESESLMIDIPGGYEFAGIDDDRQQIVLQKIKTVYPETYEECFDILGYNLPRGIEMMHLTDLECKIYPNLIKLIRCRNAYWKIAGEQMGLEKPWEPDFKDDSDKHFICYLKDEIWKSNIRDCNRFLVFPTEKIRDEFYENFKDSIKTCKNLI